jgi:hypothetical protein
VWKSCSLSSRSSSNVLPKNTTPGLARRFQRVGQDFVALGAGRKPAVIT